MVFLIIALPITPLGLGTTQAALVMLISPYAPFANPGDRAAMVLAFSLVAYFFGIIAQAGVGLWCMQKINRLDSFRSFPKENLPG